MSERTLTAEEIEARERFVENAMGGSNYGLAEIALQAKRVPELEVYLETLRDWWQASCEEVAALRRACELAREYRRAEKRGIAGSLGLNAGQLLVDVMAKEKEVDAALAAVGMPVEE